MPCRDFTAEDIVTICSDIAKRDNIRVQLNQKKSSGFFRRSSSTLSTSSETSALARRMSIQNGIPCVDPNARSVSRKSSVEVSPTQRKAPRNPFEPKVAGLKGRDVVAMAILVNDEGLPIRTYTETQQIPSDEVDAADHIFLSRVPVSTARLSPELNNNNMNSKDNYTALADLLEDLDNKQSTKLLRRLERILIKLHTTDLNTALSFLKIERYEEVRREAKEELLTFAVKEMKVTL